MLIEPGSVFFMNDDENARRRFRMGFSAITVDKIEPGVLALAQCAYAQRNLAD